MAMSVVPKMHTYVRTYTCMCVPEMNCTVCMCHVGQKGAKRGPKGGPKGRHPKWNGGRERGWLTGGTDLNY